MTMGTGAGSGRETLSTAARTPTPDPGPASRGDQSSFLPDVPPAKRLAWLAADPLSRSLRELKLVRRLPSVRSL